MRGVLARRRCLLVFEASSNILLRRFRWYIMLPHRWFRWYRAIVATLRIRRLSLTSRQNDPIYRLGWVGGADIQVGERVVHCCPLSLWYLDAETGYKVATTYTRVLEINEALGDIV